MRIFVEWDAKNLYRRNCFMEVNFSLEELLLDAGERVPDEES